MIRDVTEGDRYLDALNRPTAATWPLVRVFSGSAQSVRSGADHFGEVQKHARAEQVIAATRDQLAARSCQRREREAAKTTAARLVQDARSRPRELAQTCCADPKFIEAKFFADAGGDADNRGHFFKTQIIQTAKALGYFANLAGARGSPRARNRQPC